MLAGSAKRRLVLGAAVAVVLVALHLGLAQAGMRVATPLQATEWLYTLMLGLVILALSWSTGTRLAGGLLDPDEDGLGRQLVALGLGFGVLSQVLLVLGFLRLYYGPVFVMLAVLLAWWTRRELADAWHQLARTAPAALTILLRLPTPWHRSLALILLFIGTLVSLRDSLPLSADGVDWDGVAYQVAAPRLYAEAHRLIPVPDIALANAPSGFDIFAVLGFFAGTDTLEKALSLLFGLALGLAAVSFCRRHLPAGSGFFTVVLLFTQLWVLEQIPATKPDMATALLLVLGVSDACTWVEQRAAGGTVPPGAGAGRLRDWLGPVPGDRYLLRAGLLIGCSISTKLTSAPAAPALVLVIGVMALVLRGTGWARLGAAVRGGVLAGVGVTLPLVLWLAKSAYFFGNPLFPQGMAATSSDCSGAVCTPLPAGGGSHLWWMVTNAVGVYWVYASPVCVLLVVAPLILRRPGQRAAMLFVGLGTVIWLVFVPLYLPPRYWLGLLVVGQALTAGTVLRLLAVLPGRVAWRQSLPAFALLPQTLAALIVALGLVQRLDVGPWLAGTVSQYDYLAQRVRPFRAFAWVNDHLPPDAVVVTVHTSLGYYLQRTYLNDWYSTRFAALQAGGTARESQFVGWCTAGVHYAVFNRGRYEFDPDNVAQIQPASAYSWLRSPGLQPRALFTARGVDVLALHPCAAARVYRP